MRTALLCNSSWRFAKFNIDNPEVVACRNGEGRSCT